METPLERKQNYTVERSLWDLRVQLLDLRDNLIKIGVPIDYIEINNWPEFDYDNIHIKIWDGKEHIKGTGEPGSIDMMPLDIIAFAKRQQILRRKFDGL